MDRSEAKIKASSSSITEAARTLIGLLLAVEASEHRRTDGAKLSLEIELTGGGTETWDITIERTASSH